MSFEQLFCAIRREIDKELRRYFQKKRREAEALDAGSVELVDQLTDFTLRGGKRTRAFLVWLGSQTMPNSKCQMLNEKIPRELVSTMLAVELFQAFALIHDDIIDEDKERRGGLTVHKHFQQQFDSGNPKDSRNLRLAKHFGVSMAILAGDLAFAWAAELINETRNPRVMALFATMSEETILGQTLDVLREQAGEAIEKGRIDELKTGLYSVVRPLQLGALLAGGSAKLSGQLKSYGLAVGRAYQLRDDFLDAEIDPVQFQREKLVYLQNIKLLAARPGNNAEVKKLLLDFAGFVVTRTK